MKSVLLDTQFFHQPDSAYYAKAIDLKAISWDIISNPVEPGIWLAGPSSFDPAHQEKFPLALIWKTSSKQEPASVVEIYGHLILSPEEGEPILVKLIPNDKMPPAGHERPKRSDNPDEPETWSGGKMWFDVNGAGLAKNPGHWAVETVSGASHSDVSRFEVKGDAHRDPISQTSHAPLTAPQLAPYMAGKHHPKPPETGIVFNLAHGEDANRSPILHAAFAIPGPEKQSQFLLITAFISGPDFPEMRRWPIRIPIAATHWKDGKRTGFFSLDLRERFAGPGGRFDFVPGDYITFACRDWIGVPIHLDPKSLK